METATNSLYYDLFMEGLANELTSQLIQFKKEHNLDPNEPVNLVLDSYDHKLLTCIYRNVDMMIKRLNLKEFHPGASRKSSCYNATVTDSFHHNHNYWYLFY